MNRVVEEMIKKAKATSVANRGQYRVTVATNVFNQDGTSVEKKDNDITNDIPAHAIVVDPTVTPVAEVIKTVEDGSVIAIVDGEVAEKLVVDKSAVVQGVNAGIAQNYAQEI